MCSISSVVRYTIFKTIADSSNGGIKMREILPSLSDSQKYTVYVNLGRTSLSSYIKDRIEHGAIQKDETNGLLSLTKKGENNLKFFKKVINTSGDSRYWLDFAETLNTPHDSGKLLER